jgi:hypothetical protein
MSSLYHEVTVLCRCCGGTGKTNSPDADSEPCICCGGRGRVRMKEHGEPSALENFTGDGGYFSIHLEEFNPVHHLTFIRQEIERERLARKRDPARDDSKAAAATAEIVRFWLIISQAVAGVILLLLGIVALFNGALEAYGFLLLLISAAAFLPGAPMATAVIGAQQHRAPLPWA